MDPNQAIKYLIANLFINFSFNKIDRFRAVERSNDISDKILSPFDF